MSLLIGVLKPGSARMVCDTLTVKAPRNEPAAFHGKITALPAIGCLLGFRGLSSIHREAEWMLGTSYAAGIEDVAEILATRLPEFRDREARLLALDGQQDEARAFFMVFGRSRKAGRYKGFQLSSEDGWTVRWLEHGSYLEPLPKGTRKPPPDLPENVLVTLAHLQQKTMALTHQNEGRGHIGPGIGGDVLCYDLTDKGITIRKLGSFPDKQAVVAALEASRAGA